ncbi:MAG: hypothetical protein ACRDPB_11005, partial [Nocardioidaceae bacterium]
GVAWLLGFGAMWLSVRDQQPYRGPSVSAGVLLGVLLVAAITFTAVTVGRATHGVEGVSQVQGRMFGLAWPIGFAALFAIEGALGRYGGSSVVLGMIGAAGPLLVTSLVYLAGAATWRDVPMFAIGCWLALVAATGVWAGPVGVLLVEALGAGGGFLAMATLLAWRDHRPDRPT